MVPGVVLSQHHLPRNSFFELWDPHLVFLDSENDGESMHDLGTSFLGGSKTRPCTTAAPPRWCRFGQLIDFDRKSMEIGRTRRAESILTHFRGGAGPSESPAPPLPVIVSGAQFTFSSSELSEWAEKTQLGTLITILCGAQGPRTVQKLSFLCVCPRPTLGDQWGAKSTSPTPAPPIFVISARFCIDLACFERFLNFDPEHWTTPLRAENGGWCGGWCT